MLTLALTAAPALASSTNNSSISPDGSRVVTHDYRAPAGVSPSLSAVAPLVTSPGPWVQLRPREAKVVITVADGAHRPVLVRVDYTSAGRRAPLSTVTCDRTLSLLVAAGSRVRAEPLAGRCSNGTLSAPTTGSLTYRFFAPRIRRVVPPAKRWAALIGIKTYTRPTHDTIGGDGDIAAIRTGLLHSGWRSDHILMVSDRDATSAGIQQAMRWLVGHSAPDTFSLFHYSGHICIASRGPCGAGHTWLWTTDNRFLSEDAVAADLQGMRGHVWYDVAGCEAGAFDVGLHSPNRLFTASSQASETSYEEPSWRESEWAGLLWDRGYDRGQASGGRPFSASIDAMVRFAADQATAATAGQPAGAQHPYMAGGSPGWSLSAPPA